MKVKMKPLELLRRNVEKHIKFNDSEFDMFSMLFKSKNLKKREFLLQAGDVCKFEAFIIKGLLRVYLIDIEGKEHVLYFAPEDWWVTDIDSFINQKSAKLFIDALEDTEILLIDFEQKEYLYNKLPKVESLFRKMTQRRHVSLQRRMIDALSKTADIRYVEFLDKYPKVINRLTNLQIAAYLGISHEFLSKIRKKLATRK